MKFIKKVSCHTCPLKCDIHLTAMEMGIEVELIPLHVQYAKRETICAQNTSVNHAIIILDGNAKMFMEGINKRNIILNILMPSNYIGLISVFGLNDYNYSVAALGTCLTCQIDIELVKKMYYSNHNFMLRLNQAFGLSVASIMGKLVSLNQNQIRGKIAGSLIYLSQLNENTKFVLNITRRELGELSAVSEENAVRVLAEFRNEGIINLKGKEIEITDIPSLKKISLIG